jgi:hypothetical protein
MRPGGSPGQPRPPGSTLPAVVAFGGGHGLSASLSALRRVTDRLTAVVTVADDGGSSGRLREELDCLPPGDLRMALAALCGDDPSGRTWADVLQYRFAGSGPLGNHAIGNLLIAGLWERLGDPVAGLDMVAGLLGAKGRVLPMAAVPLQIVADVIGLDPARPDEISSIRGQAAVAKTTAEVCAVRLEPVDPPACPESVESVLAADWAVLGPGSWFTSVIPHLLVPGWPRPSSRPRPAASSRSTSSRRGRRPGSPRPSTSSCWPSTPRTCGWTWSSPTRGSSATTRTWTAGPAPWAPSWSSPTSPRGTAQPATTPSGWPRPTPRSWASEGPASPSRTASRLAWGPTQAWQDVRMAMTAQVKAELATIKVTKPCCRKSEVAATLRFAGGLHIVSGRIVIEAELDTALPPAGCAPTSTRCSATPAR